MAGACGLIFMSDAVQKLPREFEVKPQQIASHCDGASFIQRIMRGMVPPSSATKKKYFQMFVLN